VWAEPRWVVENEGQDPSRGMRLISGRPWAGHFLSASRAIHVDRRYPAVLAALAARQQHLVRSRKFEFDPRSKLRSPFAGLALWQNRPETISARASYRLFGPPCHRGQACPAILPSVKRVRSIPAAVHPRRGKKRRSPLRGAGRNPYTADPRRRVGGRRLSRGAARQVAGPSNDPPEMYRSIQRPLATGPTFAA